MIGLYNRFECRWGREERSEVKNDQGNSSYVLLCLIPCKICNDLEEGWMGKKSHRLKATWLQEREFQGSKLWLVIDGHITHIYEESVVLINGCTCRQGSQNGKNAKQNSIPPKTLPLQLIVDKNIHMQDFTGLYQHWFMFTHHSNSCTIWSLF